MRAVRSFLLVSLLCVPAVAETPTAAFAEVSGARASFEQAMAAYGQGRFRAAIEHFREADRLAPSPRLSFNIAQAYEQMQDGPNALSAYRDYLRRSPGADNSADTSVRIAELELELQRSGVQQLSVLSTPVGATVIIDDISRGVSPWTAELAPGPHLLLLRLRGHNDFRQSFELPARHAIDLVASLTPLLAPTPLAVAPRPPPAPEAPVEALPTPRWWTWAAFGGAAGLLLGSGAVELSRRSLEKDAGRPNQSQIEAEQSYDAMNRRKTTSRILLGTGVAFGALGGVSLYFDLARHDRARTTLGLGCAGSECRALARGCW
ncbi:MAG: PEGA domain-containing protein [Deltaproteobacteria bacterium]